MVIDRYTKTVLTVIALSLAVIALRGVTPIGSAIAQSNEPIKVQICDEFFSSRCAEVSTHGAILVEIDD